MASNIQRGTRGLSAGDWVRLQRLRGGRNFQADKPSDITNPPARSEPESGRRIYTEFGTSKIRRPASNWTDYKAAQTADYVLERSVGTCGASGRTNTGVARSLTINKICICDTTSAIKHNGVCVKCSK
jgi:hypothetical protein